MVVERDVAPAGLGVTHPRLPGGDGARANKFTQFAQKQTAMSQALRPAARSLADGVKPLALPDARNGAMPKRVVSEGCSGRPIAAESAARAP